MQVSTTAEFTNIIETSPRVDQTTYTAKTKTYPDGPLFWRVRAYDASDNPLTYSCATGGSHRRSAAALQRLQRSKRGRPRPTQVLPANRRDGQQRSGDVMAADAVRQDLPGRGLHEPRLGAERRPTGWPRLTTRGAAASALTTFATGAYGWRVRRVDVNNLPGAWTTETNPGLRRFTVDGPVATLTAPASAATVQSDSILLQWAPVAGASRYRVDVATDSFATVFETATTDTTSWAPGLVMKRWTAGNYQWRVTTLDANGQPLASSETRGFTIQTPPAVPTSVTATAGNGQATVTLDGSRQ